MHFYTIKEAAAAIAGKLCPDDATKRAEVAERYWHLVYDKLCGGKLIGRDSDGREPIDHTRLGAPIAFHGCVISERDLNEWLDGFGIGVHIDGPTSLSPDENAGELSERPRSKQLAEAFGPYLSNGGDSESLGRMLGDADRYPKLKRYREMRPTGGRSIAFWDAGGVALCLVEQGSLTLQSAREALKKHYPKDERVLDHIPSLGDMQPATWFPSARAGS
ncbi:hypothetical protein [Ralstonia solanacearum]|uniref:Uncharacterized protein n=1 Tax=Ralstonia solanacearum TaxID=305 RepID=A0A7X0ULZ0_RALSL|nr:hypothetical protein [Ralstonia solanacearum]MBB6581901.1 hypothetical protein [Ralstonia solanacearum]MBB6584730.1 hypothetical protein [Ralstonia solanacearum]MDB0524535.1 hypothetical protein [Ralstonia solanacearum]